jgi:anti-sigma factor ChrR (cupin superfamily)
VVSPVLEQAGLPQDVLALLPDDSVLVVPQAGVRSSRAAPPALRVQQDGSGASPPADLVLALPPDDWAAPEQRVAHSQLAALDGSRADSQADQVAPQQADSQACP